MAGPTHRGSPICNGWCECGQEFRAANGVGLASQHFHRCGRTITMEVLNTYSWRPRLAGDSDRKIEGEADGR